MQNESRHIFGGSGAFDVRKFVIYLELVALRGNRNEEKTERFPGFLVDNTFSFLFKRLGKDGDITDDGKDFAKGKD